MPNERTRHETDEALALIRGMMVLPHADLMGQGWFHTQSVGLEAMAVRSLLRLQVRPPCELTIASGPPAERPGGHVERPQLLLVDYQGEGWLCQLWTRWPAGTTVEEARDGKVAPLQVTELEGVVAVLVRLGDLAHRMDHQRHGEMFCPGDEPPVDVAEVYALRRQVGWAIAIISNVDRGNWAQADEWNKAARAFLDEAHAPPAEPDPMEAERLVDRVVALVPSLDPNHGDVDTSDPAEMLAAMFRAREARLEDRIAELERELAEEVRTRGQV